MMKKQGFRLISIIVIILGCIMSFTITFGSENYKTNKLDIEGANVSVSLPDGYIVFTREMKDDDPNLSSFGLKKEDLMFEEQNLYLDAIDSSSFDELTLVVTDYNFVDFRYLTGEDFDYLKEILPKVNSLPEMQIDKVGTYTNSESKYIYIYFSANGPTSDNSDVVHGLSYTTAINGKQYVFAVKSYGNAISEQAESALKNLVDSAVFQISGNSRTSNAESISFSEPVSGVQFDIPANYTEYNKGKLSNGASYMFQCQTDPGIFISYSYDDMFNRIPYDLRGNTKRDDMSDSIYTDSDAYGMFTHSNVIKESTVSSVFYNGIHYFMRECTYLRGNSSQTDIEMRMTELIHIEKGIMHLFCITASKDNSHFKELEKVLSNVVYKAPKIYDKGSIDGSPSSLLTPLYDDYVPDKMYAVTNDSQESTQSMTSQSTRYESGNINREINTTLGIPELFSNQLFFMILGIILTIVIHPLPILIYRYKTRKKPVPKTKAKLIVIIDTILVFALHIFIEIVLSKNGYVNHGVFRIGGVAYLFWAFISYRCLIGGSDTSDSITETDNNDFSHDSDKKESIIINGGNCTDTCAMSEKEHSSSKEIMPDNTTLIQPRVVKVHHTLKWHNFLMVTMIIGAILAIINGISVLTGSSYQYGVSPSQIYNYYPELQACDIFYGIGLLIQGIFQIKVRHNLHGFKANAIGMMVGFHIYTLLLTIVYMTICSLTINADILTSSSSIGAIVATFIFLAINYTYYDHRRDLFISY